MSLGIRPQLQRAKILLDIRSTCTPCARACRSIVLQSGKKSAIDFLSETRLVNYFGKAFGIDEIEINPVLIRKGLFSCLSCPFY